MVEEKYICYYLKRWLLKTGTLIPDIVMFSEVIYNVNTKEFIKNSHNIGLPDSIYMSYWVGDLDIFGQRKFKK